MNIRALAARSLASVLQQKSALDAAFERQQGELSQQDRGLYKGMCYGTCRHFFSLDAALGKLLSKPMKAKDSDVKALLLVGIYQLWHMRVPDHAAINETVNATKSLKKPWAKNLVNAVLRNFLREKEALTSDFDQYQQEHPKWLLTKIKNAWPDAVEAITKANNTQAPFTLRVNAGKNDRSRYCEILTQHDVTHTLCEHSSDGITLAEPIDVMLLPGFSEGSCSVQDEAAQLSAQLLDLHPHQRVLDACCAPGGKTCHIAECQPELDELVALDVDATRLEKVEENLSRLALNASLTAADAANTQQWWDGQAFDRILLDAPCSATGVIRRHPDIKLLRRESDIAELGKLQLKILQQLWQTLTPGGILLYATCSILPEENENLIKTFVEQQDDAIHLAIDATWGEQRPYGRQLFPQINGHDGFYYARIKKAQN